jgi:biopolymer transport protein ExbD
MAFSSNSGSGPMADINVTPLVDVMLVLLIIFMVTAPALSFQTQVDLPQPVNPPPPPPVNPPDPIRIRVDAGGTVTWNNATVSMKQLEAELRGIASLEESRVPMLEIETDPEAEYDTLAKVLTRAKNQDLKKISFVNQ